MLEAGIRRIGDVMKVDLFERGAKDGFGLHGAGTIRFHHVVGKEKLVLGCIDVGSLSAEIQLGAIIAVLILNCAMPFILKSVLIIIEAVLIRLYGAH